LGQRQESGVEVEVDEDDVRGPLAEKPGELGTIGGDAVLVAAVSQDELQHLREWVVHDDHDARPRNRWARVRHEVFSLSRPRDGAFMAVARSVRATMNGVRGRTPALRTVTGLARPNPASERRGLIGGDERLSRGRAKTTHDLRLQDPDLRVQPQPAGGDLAPIRLFV